MGLRARAARVFGRVSVGDYLCSPSPLVVRRLRFSCSASGMLYFWYSTFYRVFEMCSTSFLKFCLEAELELKIAFTVVRKSILVIFEKNLS